MAGCPEGHRGVLGGGTVRRPFRGQGKEVTVKELSILLATQDQDAEVLVAMTRVPWSFEVLGVESHTGYERVSWVVADSWNCRTVEKQRDVPQPAVESK